MGRLRTNVDAPKLIKSFDNYIDIEKIEILRKPLVIEIGSGKGDFLIESSQKNKKILFLGIEKYATVILKALKKIQRIKLKINNLYFTCLDMQNFDSKKFKHKVKKIFLNFSDPWPKKRHEKRRLTSNFYLDLYKQILKEDCFVEFKTDNTDFYRYTLTLLKTRKDIDIVYHTSNLHNNLLNKFNKDNVQTEYEKKFVKLNKAIKKIVWRYKNAKNI